MGMTEKPLSLRKYAQHRGTSHTAVQRAIESGRLRESIVHVNGVPKIRDLATADAEWHANTRATIATMAQPVPPPAELMATGEPRAVPDLQESRARLECARADLAELELAERRRELVPASDIAAKFEDVVTSAKTKLLGLASRIKQRMPHIVETDIRAIDDLVREALESLADGR
jgi:phage terminase Nu1 subunit (DNA packaging protein)